MATRPVHQGTLHSTTNQDNPDQIKQTKASTNRTDQIDKWIMSDSRGMHRKVCIIRNSTEATSQDRTK